MDIKIKNILWSTDFSDYSNHAASYGIALAKEFSAKLYACHIIDLSSATMYEGFPDPLEQQNRIFNYASGYLDRLIGEQPFEWEPVVEIGRTADQIARIAEEKRVDLAILATHGRSGLKRFVLGSVTELLMRTLRCPLLIVRSPEHDFVSPAKGEIRLQKILVGCDFSPDSSLAFQYGLYLAQNFQTELHLAHVLLPPVFQEYARQRVESVESIQPEVREQLHEKLMNMVTEEARVWCTPKVVLLAGGPPYEELTKYAADNNIDLIVLGVRGHSLFETLLMGSTTARVIRQAPCPVLSVCPVITEKKKSAS